VGGGGRRGRGERARPQHRDHDPARHAEGPAHTLLLLAINLIVLVIAVSVLWSSRPVIMASRFQTLSALGVTQIWGYLSLVYAFGLIAVLAALDALSLMLSGASIVDDDPTLKSLS
jgi:TRAP-type C4-dicarboxylate transport system permease small subunit